MDDTAIVAGDDIVEIGSFLLEIKTEESFEKGNTYIPFHRIFKIEYDDEIVFERRR